MAFEELRLGLTYQVAATWDGTTIDMRAWPVVTIWCSVAPGTARDIQAGPASGEEIVQTAIANTSSGISQVQSISTVGRFVVSGGAWVELGGSGGTFKIAGSMA